VARLIARSGSDAARRLDVTSATLHQSPDRTRSEAAVAHAWSSFLAGLLSRMTPPDRELAVADLRVALDQLVPPASAGDGSPGAGQINVTVIGRGSAQMPTLASGTQYNTFWAPAPCDSTGGS
jgi:hypothetical protein